MGLIAEKCLVNMTKKSTRWEWTEQDLNAVFIDVMNQGMSTYAVGKLFKIPDRTLRRRRCV